METLIIMIKNKFGPNFLLIINLLGMKMLQTA